MAITSAGGHCDSHISFKGTVETPWRPAEPSSVPAISKTFCPRPRPRSRPNRHGSPNHHSPGPSAPFPRSKPIRTRAGRRSHTLLCATKATASRSSSIPMRQRRPPSTPPASPVFTCRPYPSSRESSRSNPTIHHSTHRYSLTRLFISRTSTTVTTKSPTTSLPAPSAKRSSATAPRSAPPRSSSDA